MQVQSIMFLAGSGTSKSPKTSHSRCYVQAPTPGNTIGNHGVLKQPTAQPCSGLSSPFSVISHLAPKMGSGPSNMEKGNTERVIALSKVDNPKTVGAMRSISATTRVSAGRILMCTNILASLWNFVFCILKFFISGGTLHLHDMLGVRSMEVSCTLNRTD